jgi:hypothetical protein
MSRCSTALPDPATVVEETIEIDQLVPDDKVREEFGDISEMGLWRWDHDPDLEFPPAIYIRRRKFRSRRMLEDFKRKLIRRAIEKRAAQADATAA